MATKPTRLQQQAADQLAEVLRLIPEAARLDGGTRLDRDSFVELAGRVAGLSTAFDLEALVARALARRTAALGLRSDAAELLTLLDADVRPLEMLLLSDDDLQALVIRLEEELGDV